MRKLALVLGVLMLAPAAMAAPRAKPAAKKAAARKAQKAARRANRPVKRTNKLRKRTRRAPKAKQEKAQPKKLVNSIVRFNASHPEVQAFAKSKGWLKPGARITVSNSQLVYTTDGWKTTHTVPGQYLMDGRQGFILRGVPKGTNIEYAIETTVLRSTNNFRSFTDRATIWVNNGGYGVNHRGVTEAKRAPK